MGVGSTSFGRPTDGDGVYFFTLGFRQAGVENKVKSGARELTFRRADDIKTFRFSKKPLGLTFNKEAPVVIDSIAPLCSARSGCLHDFVPMAQVFEYIGTCPRVYSSLRRLFFAV